MILGVIADDVTGASDLASVLRREGLEVVQTLGVPTAPPPPVDAVVVSLKTRTVPPDEARSAALAAAEALAAAGAEQYYFKYCSTFDSTERGNIGPVIEALLDHLGISFTIASPSYPALERTVYLGHLFVGDRLLSDSSMRNHPLTPMTDSDLVRVLGRQFRSPVGLVPLDDVEAGPTTIRSRFEELVSGGYGAAIVDAVFDRHLDAAAEACADLRLVTGGAGLGGALARFRQRSAVGGACGPPARVRRGPAAVLSGSCSAATIAQVERFAGRVHTRSLDPVALVDDDRELERLLDWARGVARRGEHLFIYSTATPALVREAQDRLGREAAASRIEDAFQRLARVLADCGVRTFVVAGGETSGAVLQALGIRMIGFGADLAPGVPWTFSIDPEGFTLALKSGNFGDQDFFIRAIEEVS